MGGPTSGSAASLRSRASTEAGPGNRRSPPRPPTGANRSTSLTRPTAGASPTGRLPHDRWRSLDAHRRNRTVNDPPCSPWVPRRRGVPAVGLAHHRTPREREVNRQQDHRIQSPPATPRPSGAPPSGSSPLPASILEACGFAEPEPSRNPSLHDLIRGPRHGNIFENRRLAAGARPINAASQDVPARGSGEPDVPFPRTSRP